MLLTCPSCGARASIQAWENDADQRSFMQLLGDMPRPVSSRLLRYCALFRSPGAARGMSWKKANRLAHDLQELVSKGYVHTKGKPDRNCTSQHWGDGMDTMIQMGEIGTLSLPMKTHNYLCSIVWQKADEAGAAVEQVRRNQEASGRIIQQQKPPQRSDSDDDLSPFDQAYIKKHGREAWNKMSGDGTVEAFKVSAKKLGKSMSIDNKATTYNHDASAMSALLRNLDTSGKAKIAEASRAEVAEVLALPTIMEQVAAVRRLQND